MFTIQIKTPITPEQLLSALDQMPAHDLDLFVLQVLALRAEREAPHASPSESDILVRINRGLPPIVLHRYAELIGKRQQGSLADEEYAELLQLTDQVEAFDADRLAALAEFAQRRQISLAQAMQRLGIQPLPYAS